MPPPESPTGPLLLALDQGGSSSRALLFDEHGREVAAAHVPVATQHRGEDRVEQDPEEIVRSLRLAAADACESPAARDRPVVAAGLATQRSTVVCWDRATGRPLSEAISWQDRRSANWLERLRPLESRIRARTGLVLSPHYGASKLRWCLDHLPGVQAAARDGRLAMGPLAAFLCHRLLRERPLAVDPSNASRTLLWDPATLDWAPELLEAFELPARALPRSVPTRFDYGTLELGGRRVPLRVCTGDQGAAAFARGPLHDGTAYVNAGTGAFAQRAAARGAALPAGLLRSVLYSDGADAIFSLEGTVNGAGSAIEWLRERVALDVDRALETLAASPLSETAPLFFNGVGGLGAPFWRPSFPTEFSDGTGDETTRLAAVVESVAFLLTVNLQRLGEAGPLSRVLLTGGLSRSDLLCRLLADASGLVVERSELREATARGVACLTAGQPASWAQDRPGATFRPGDDGRARARFERWLAGMAARGASLD